MTKDGLIGEYISTEGEREFHNPGRPKEQPAITSEEMDAVAAKFLNPRTPKELPAAGDTAPAARTAPTETAPH